MINLTFNGQQNISLSVGDTIYYVNGISDSGGFNTTDANGQSNIIEFGTVNTILQGNNQFTIIISEMPGVALPTISSFILFSKDNKAELSSIVGYYSEVQLSNNSSKKAELFSLNVDVTPSSK